MHVILFAICVCICSFAFVLLLLYRLNIVFFSTSIRCHSLSFSVVSSTFPFHLRQISTQKRLNFKHYTLRDTITYAIINSSTRCCGEIEFQQQIFASIQFFFSLKHTANVQPIKKSIELGSEIIFLYNHNFKIAIVPFHQ